MKPLASLTNGWVVLSILLIVVAVTNAQRSEDSETDESTDNSRDDSDDEDDINPCATRVCPASYKCVVLRGDQCRSSERRCASCVRHSCPPPIRCAPSCMPVFRYGCRVGCNCTSGPVINTTTPSAPSTLATTTEPSTVFTTTAETPTVLTTTATEPTTVFATTTETPIELTTTETLTEITPTATP